MTVEIPLTKGYVTVVDDEDTDLAEVKWHAATFKHTDVVYATRQLPAGKGKQKRIFMHQVILSRNLGRELVKGELPDHVDLNGLNNRRGNIRLSTQSQNYANKRVQRNSKSGIKGVRWVPVRQKWRASIKVNKVVIFLGFFTEAQDAAEAYRIAAEKYFGEFARTK